MPRAGVDTNVWVSALLNPAGYPARILAAADAGRFTIVVSEPMLTELAEVLGRRRIRARLGLSDEELANAIARIWNQSELVRIVGDVRLCRDPDDDVVIETAMRGRADVLVTRDGDLKGAADIVAVLRARGVAVLSVQQFLDVLDAGDDAPVGPASS